MRLLLILFCFFNSLNHSIAQSCVSAIDKNTFQEGFNQVAVQSTSVKKLTLALSFIKNKCLEATQVKTMAQLFSDDATRLDFCKASYERTTDKNNFYDVYDAFTNFSFAFRLHDFVSNRTTANEPTPPSIPVESTITFPKYTYPSSANYRGVKGCEGPVARTELFMQAAANVFAQPTDESKQLAIANACQELCLDFAQLMKLVTLVKAESNRLKILTSTFPSVYDLESYKAGGILLTDKKLQTEWLRYGNAYLTSPAEICEESASDFEKSLKSVHDKFFDHERIKIIEAFAVDHCFSVAQIKRLVNEITPASRTVDIFKKLYDRCSDKKNYSTLANELFFASEKEQLLAFIKSKEK